jgi:hypothetical protein
LVELLVVMAVFIIVIIISADSFNTILSQAAKLHRSEESNIEGMVGLEMLRHDLQQGGYGLFTETSPVAYSEAAYAPATSFNETSTTSAPRAFVGGNNLAATAETSSGATYNILAGTDYLTIKGTSVARTKAAQKWTHLLYNAGTGGVPNIWPSSAENFVSNDRVVLLRRQVTPTTNTLTLVPDNSDFYFAYSNAAFERYSTNSSQYIIYGLDSAGVTPRRPFNRTDYFVASPQGAVPPLCAPNSGVLYKTVVNQSDGKLTYYPVLDCVADMQVVYGWDLMNGSSPGQDGTVDTWTTPDGTSFSCSGAACALVDPDDTTKQYAQNALNKPATIRNALKVVKVYILAQNGRRDSGYTSPTPILVGDSGELSLTRSVDIAAAGWSNYRWKLYRIVVRPKNLLANQ